MRTPRIVFGLLAIDVGLVLAYLIDSVITQPGGPFSRFVDLDGENNLPTWFSSVQWFCVAWVFWAFSKRTFDRRRRWSWLLFALPIIFIAFSLDEVAVIHEQIGFASDALLPDGEREGTIVTQTGVFFLLVGIPFVVAFAGIAAAILPFLARPPGARALFVVGLTLSMGAFVGIEALSNFVTEGTTLARFQIAVEEMTEMIGATLTLWSGIELLWAIPGSDSISRALLPDRAGASEPGSVS